MVAAHHHVLRTQRHAVLEVLLILVERVVLVDVLHVGRGLGALVVVVGAGFRRGRVALGVVEPLVALEDGELLLVVVVATVVVVGVARGVGLDALVGLGTHAALDVGEVVHVGGERQLLLAAQSVETHVLLGAVGAGVVEGIDEAGRRGHTAPLGLHVAALHVGHGHAVLVELLAVLEHVLAHLTKVDVHVATACFGVVDEGVEHPELDVLDVGALKVGRRELAHDTAPALLGIGELAVGSKVGVEVVGAALVGVVGEVEHREGRRLAVGALLVGVELALVDLTHVVVGELVEVALDVGWRER